MIQLATKKMMAELGHKHVGKKKGVAVLITDNNTFFSPSVGNLNCLLGCRPLDSCDFSLARIAPKNIPSV